MDLNHSIPGRDGSPIGDRGNGTQTDSFDTRPTLIRSAVPVPATYEAQWRDYRRRILAIPLALFGGFVVMIIVNYPLALTMTAMGLVHLPSWLENSLFGVAPITWIGSLLFAMNRWTRFSCPRCSKIFSRPEPCSYSEMFNGNFNHFNSYYHTSNKNCLNCGLPKWANVDPDAKHPAGLPG